MAQAVICAACGAKVKGDRARCPRCREPLVARQAAAAPHNRWVAAGIVAGCVALGGFSMVLVTISRPTPVAQTVRAAASAPPVRSVSAAPAVSDISSPAATPEIAAASLISGGRAYDSGKIDAALQEFQAAAAANPNDPRALNNLGQVLTRLGRAQEAVPYLEQAVEQVPDSWAYQFNRARAYAQLKEWGPAIAGYQRASQLFPTDYATQYNLAKALQASGDVRAAVPAYEKAIELAPSQSDFRLSYGLALEAAARPKDAAAAYRQYLELEPGAPEADKIKAHLAQLLPENKDHVD